MLRHCFMIAALVALVSTSAAYSAEEKKAEPKKPDAKKTDAATKDAVKEKPKGRLPPHYGDLVTPEQKDKIYAIQEKYDADIDKLEAELKDIKEKRMHEIEGVLTKEQKEKLAALVAAAKEKKPDEKAEAKPDAAKGATKKDDAPKK